jgi:hypothetical protein
LLEGLDGGGMNIDMSEHKVLWELKRVGKEQFIITDDKGKATEHYICIGDTLSIILDRSLKVNVQ